MAHGPLAQYIMAKVPPIIIFWYSTYAHMIIWSYYVISTWYYECTSICTLMIFLIFSNHTSWHETNREMLTLSRSTGRWVRRRRWRRRAATTPSSSSSSSSTAPLASTSSRSTFPSPSSSWVPGYIYFSKTLDSFSVLLMADQNWFGHCCHFHHQHIIVPKSSVLMSSH